MNRLSDEILDRSPMDEILDHGRLVVRPKRCRAGTSEVRQEQCKKIPDLPRRCDLKCCLGKGPATLFIVIEESTSPACSLECIEGFCLAVNCPEEFK